MIRFEQHLAEQLVRRRDWPWRDRRLVGRIFERRRSGQRPQRVLFPAFGPERPSLRRLALDVELRGPVRVFGLDFFFAQRDQLLDLGFREVRFTRSRGAERAREAGDRFDERLRAWPRRQCRCLRPRAALDGPARRNRGRGPSARGPAGHSRHGRHVGAATGRRRRARDDLVHAVENLLRRGILGGLQIRVHLVVPRMQRFAGVVPLHRDVVRPDVRVDRFLPRADAGERVRRHVERVRRVGREVRVLARIWQRARRERRYVVAVNQVMRHAGMIGFDRVELLQNRRGFELVGVGLVGRQRRLIDGERVERRSLEVGRVFRVDALHRFLVRDGPRAVIQRVGVLVEERHSRNVLALALALGADRLRRLRRRETLLQRFRRAQPRERVAPRAHGDPPLRDAARRIAFKGFLEAGDRVGEFEGVEERHRVIEFLGDRRRARRGEMNLPEPLTAGSRRLRGDRRRRGECEDQREREDEQRAHNRSPSGDDRHAGRWHGRQDLPKVAAPAFRISSDSFESSTARASMSAPTRPAIVASAFSRRAAADRPCSSFPRPSTLERSPSVKTRRTVRGWRTTSDPSAANRHPCPGSSRWRGDRYPRTTASNVGRAEPATFSIQESLPGTLAHVSAANWSFDGKWP